MLRKLMELHFARKHLVDHDNQTSNNQPNLI